MQKIIIGVIVLAVIVFGAWYFTANPIGQSGPNATSTEQVATTTATSTSSAGGTQSTNSTLRALVTQSGNFTCNVTAVQSSGLTTGTIYGAGGKLRLDFTAPSQNGTIQSHIIRSGGFSYIWVDGQTTGIKTAVTANDTVTPASSGNISDDSKVSSECHPWSPDTTQFTPPKGITFVAH